MLDPQESSTKGWKMMEDDDSWNILKYVEINIHIWLRYAKIFPVKGWKVLEDMRIGYSNSPVEHDDDPEFEHLEDLRCPKNIIFRAFFWEFVIIASGACSAWKTSMMIKPAWVGEICLVPTISPRGSRLELWKSLRLHLYCWNPNVYRKYHSLVSSSFFMVKYGESQVSSSEITIFPCEIRHVSSRISWCPWRWHLRTP